MNGDRCDRCARIQGVIGLVLLAPLLALYGLWLAGGRLADLADQRRARRRCPS